MNIKNLAFCSLLLLMNLPMASAQVLALSLAAGCEVQLIEPHSGQEVSSRVVVKGSAKLPSDHHLWVFARHERFASLGVWWPQGEAIVDPKTDMWKMVATLGGPQDIHDHFALSAAVMAPQQHVRLVDYLKRASASNAFPPIEMPPAACVGMLLRVKKTKH